MSAWRAPSLWVSLAAVAALGLWPVATGAPAARETVFTVLVAISLATSLNLMLGYTGYVNFGHIVFFGLGGYTGFFAVERFGAPLWLGAAAGGAAASALALLFGRAILGLRGAYFALATIGVNEAVRAGVANFPPFGGPTGLSLDFAVYQAYGGPARMLWVVYAALLVLTLVGVAASHLVRSSRFGLSLLAIREDEDAAEVMGVVAPRAKTWAYVLSAIVPGMVGVLFFFKNGNVEPGDAFRLAASIDTIVMVMLGGQGTVLGPILGAAGYQGLRGFLLTSPAFKNVQLAVAGAMLLAIVLFVPAGVVGWLRGRGSPGLRRWLA